jgi:hypothetical protein
MRRTLSLSKETLRILDDEELALVAGGADDPHKKGKGHGKTGNSGSCNANNKKSNHSSCP